MYTVKEVAEMMDMSPHTLRYYDDQDLFPYVSRDENNVRQFSESDLEWVNLIKCLKETGMPLAEINRYVELCREGDSTIEERYRIILKQKKKAEEEVAAMQKRVERLNVKQEYYKRLLAEQQADNWNPEHSNS
ncbi:MAG: MerR family transcriptional regulator [Bacillota bacterium]